MQTPEQSGIGGTTAWTSEPDFDTAKQSEQTSTHGTNSPLVAYHNDPAVKERHVVRMRAHQKADELIHGTHWKDGKGSVVGCTVHSSDYTAYETELGMPVWLAFLEDQIFDGMPKQAAQRFPLRLLEAMPVGFYDWDGLYHDFCAHALRDICKFDRTRYPNVATVLDSVVRLHEEWRDANDPAWILARTAAKSEVGAESYAAHCTARATEVSARPTAALSTYEVAWVSEFAAEAAARSTRYAANEASTMAAKTEYARMGDWLVKRLASA